MMPEDVRKAVERLNGAFTMTGVIAHGDDWMAVRAHLLAREAEVERLQDSVSALGLQGAEFMGRCERAEALLRECSGNIHHPGAGKLEARITAHLSENSRG